MITAGVFARARPAVAAFCAALVTLLAACGAGDGGERPAGGRSRPGDDARAFPAADGEGDAAVAPDPAHSSRNALDWAGNYEGVLPCADCGGIETRITLTGEGTYRLQQRYQGKGAAPFEETGTFRWDDAGATIALTLADGTTQIYQVGENRLFHLDRAGQRITGALADMYELEKRTGDPSVEGWRWVLIELDGEPFSAGGTVREAFLTLDPVAGRVSGNTSCNSFSGPYELAPGQRLRFGERMVTTKMACPAGSIETRFLEMLQRVDSYSLADDVLSLNRARMAPLARFRRDPADASPTPTP